MNGWNYADESGPISLGPQGVVETEQSLQLSSQQNLNTVFAIATTPPESPTSSPAPARPVPPKRQYHSLVLKFVIELATNVPFIALDELQTKRGGRVAHGASMKASQGRWRGQEVAVKTVNDDLIPKWTDEFNEEKKRKFRKTIKDLIYEIRAISHTTLRGHRNIVTLLAIGIEDTYINSTENDGKENTILEAFSPILVLPWALSDLDSLWAKGTLERPEEAADIVSDIADGLMALHKHDIVHGDIKPGNILLFQDPKDAHRLVAKIADFGAISSKQNNRYNSNEGTIGWAAPECFQNPNQAPTEFDFDSGRARDVFSFGLVAMHVALEGRFGREWQSDVDRRREYLDYALTKHYTEKWPTHQQLLVRWRTLLRDTVVEKPRERMNPDHLTNIRKRLLDR
jgi:serine/threonine protein kinase